MLGGYAFWALNAGRLATLPTAVALPLSLLFVLAVGAITELAVYRPLRNSSPLAKLVSSLGVLLIAQSAMILAFGVTPQPEPGILPTNVVHIFGRGGPDRPVHPHRHRDRGRRRAGRAVQVDSVRARHPGHRGERDRGDAQRAVAERHLACQHAARVAAGRGARHPGRLDHPTRPADATAADHPGASRRAHRVVHLVRHRVRAASLGIGIMYSLVQYASAQSWFPQSGGVSLPGVTDLLAFLIIVVVLFWRGSRIPGRGELVERRLPECCGRST